MFPVIFTLGDSVGAQDCERYSTTPDSLEESTEVFILDLVSSNPSQIVSSQTNGSTIVRIEDGEGKLSLGGNQNGR